MEYPQGKSRDFVLTLKSASSVPLQNICKRIKETNETYQSITVLEAFFNFAVTESIQFNGTFCPSFLCQSLFINPFYLAPLQIST